ncbi:hypothetical protein L7F22_042741 [Adiantum nelumboides]|nr:hypothetical protein [Adiantum nelumboides]
MVLMAATTAVIQWQANMDFLLNGPKLDGEACVVVEEERDNFMEMLLPALHSVIAACALSQRRRKNSAPCVWYVKSRSRHFWHTFFDYREEDDIRFEENLRIPRSCFEYVCNLVCDDLQQGPILVQIAEAVPSQHLSVKKKVAMSLHLLGVDGPIHNVANTYGMGRSMVSRLFWQFITAMFRHRSTFIHWPRTPQELQPVKDGFESKQGFPNCCGALDVTHSNMELLAKETHAHWYDRDHVYSMTLQAVVNSACDFWTSCVGCQGLATTSAY